MTDAHRDSTWQRRTQANVNVSNCSCRHCVNWKVVCGREARTLGSRSKGTERGGKNDEAWETLPRVAESEGK